jgi:flagellar basal body L-ring protein FlgH
MTIGIINLVTININENIEQPKQNKKKCIKCGLERDLSEFYNSRNVCKICHIEHYKLYYKTKSKNKYKKGGEYYKYTSKKVNKDNKIMEKLTTVI